MVFAGDFAQLPPAVGGEGMSLYSHSIGSIASSMKSQEEAIGKALWHQVTTVCWKVVCQGVKGCGGVSTDEGQDARDASLI